MEEYVQGSRKSAAVVVILIVLFCLGVILLEPFADFVIGYDTHLASTNVDAAIKQEMRKVEIVTLYVSVILACMGALVLAFGVKVVRSQEFPPPGYPLPVRIRRIKGHKAVQIGRSECLVGIMTLVFAAANAWVSL